MGVRVCPRCQAALIHLTDRRRALLDAVLAGLEDKEIAARLGVAPSTIHAQLRELYRETEARNRVQLAVWWQGFRQRNQDLFPHTHD